MAAKQLKTKIKLVIPGGEANPAPPIGPALGQHGINISEFCKRFNDLTQKQKGELIPVEMNVYTDRTFDFKLKTPPTSYLIKKAARIEKGSKEPKKNKVAKLTKTQIQEIAKKKMVDLNADTLETAEKIVAGTAKSMGVEIEK